MKKNIPVIISQKDRLYIQDILNISKVYLKKSHLYLGYCNDEDVQHEISSFMDTLFDSYDQLLFILEEKK